MKGLVCAEGRIGYRFVPKTASTSIKRALFEYETGRPFDADEVGATVHGYMRKRFLANLKRADFTFIVVRDPVARFLSGYSNRVRGLKELSRRKIQVKHPELLDVLPKFDPGIDEFIDNFEIYHRARSIRHHLAPLESLLKGSDLGYFTQVYRLDETDQLAGDLSELLDHDIHFGRSQTSRGPRLVPLQQLERSRVQWIIDRHAADYELLDGWYSPDDVWRRWSQPS